MGSGGNTVQTTEPWGGQQRFLYSEPPTGERVQGIYNQANILNRSGQGFNPYEGQRIAGFDPWQTQGQNMLAGSITGGTASPVAAEGMLNRTLQGGMGVNPSYLGGAMAQNQAGVPGIQNAMNQSWMNQPTAGNILGTAQGGYLGGNAALNDVYNTAARKATEAYQQGTMPGIRAGAQGAGMGASSRNALAQGQATGMFGQGLQDLAGQIYAPAYEAERNRMMQASGLGLQGYGQDIGAQLQGAGMLQAGQENYLNRLLGGAGLQGTLGEAERGRQMQAAGLSPMISGWGANQLMSLGGMNQAQQQQQLGAQQALWNEQQSEPWQRLGAYNQILTGGGSPGSVTTTSQGGGFNPLGMLGGMGTGAGIGGAMGAEMAAAGMANPFLLPLILGGGLLGGIR